MSALPDAFRVEELFRRLPLAEFFDRYYLKLPCAGREGCEAACRIAGWETCLRLIAHPEADVIIGRGGQRWDGDIPRESVALRQVLDQGYTLGIRHADRLDTGLQEIRTSFQAAFAAPTDVHLYCTPAEQTGFGWHYDAEEVFVLQTAGEKEWRLRKNTVHPWPLMEAIPADQHYERERMPVFSCRLAARDWLYIPAGYWHSTVAQTESISLSIGLRSAAAIDAFDFLRPRLVQSLLWRQRLPCLGDVAPTTAEERCEQLRQVFAELSADLSAQLLRADFVEEYIAAQVGR